MQFAGGPRFIVTPLHSLQSSPLAAGGMKHHGGKCARGSAFSSYNTWGWVNWKF
jgi:hypothetical protein